MKQWMALALIALLLTGCAGGGETPVDTTPPTTTAPATEPGLYQPDSDVEHQSQGSLWAYPLGREDYTGMIATDSGVVLFSGESGTRLRLLTGDTCREEKTGQLEVTIAPGQTGFYQVAQGFAYYDEQTHEVVLVNRDLKCANRILLPQDLVGIPAVTSDLKTLYYCTAEGVRAMDISNGVTRMLRSQTDSCLTMGQVLFGNTVVTCTMVGENGSRYTAYLSTENGQLLGVDDMQSVLTAAGDAYFLKRMDGTLEQMIFGRRGQDSRVFVPRQTGDVWALPQLHGALLVNQGTQTQLDLYDFATGRHLSSLAVTGLGQLRSVMAGEDGIIWLLAQGDSGEDILYRWDYIRNPTGDTTDYTEPWYTAEDPDTQGLEALAQRAKALGDTYGITIRIWEDGVKDPGNLILKAEYQTRTIAQTLDRLEALFAQLPEEFLDKVGSVADCGWIRVNLVRSILTGQTQAQYWQDGNAYVTLVIGDSLEADFCRGLSGVLDTYVRNRSNILDDWDTYNPPGFTYGQQADGQWLEGEERAFVNAQAMTGEREDRAELLAAAMLPENEAIFESPMMQQKLDALCRAIRAAAKWKKDTRSFLWEQYLDTPLAYEK